MFRGLDLDAMLDLSTEGLMDILHARARRRFNRGLLLKRNVKQLKKKLLKAKKECTSAYDKPDVVKTHLRDMLVIPEMIGSVVGVHNGKVFTSVEVKADMVGRYLGEFSITYKPVRHGRPGIGATSSSKFIPLKCALPPPTPARPRRGGRHSSHAARSGGRSPAPPSPAGKRCVSLVGMPRAVLPAATPTVLLAASLYPARRRLAAPWCLAGGGPCSRDRRGLRRPACVGGASPRDSPEAAGPHTDRCIGLIGLRGRHHPRFRFRLQRRRSRLSLSQWPRSSLDHC